MRIRFISPLLATTVAAALALTACTPLDTADPAPKIAATDTVAAPTIPIDVRGEWYLSSTTIGSDSVTHPATEVSVIFYDGALRVQTGCENYDLPMSSELGITTSEYEPVPRAQCLAIHAPVPESLVRVADVTNLSRADDTLTLSGAGFSLTFSRTDGVDR